MVMALVAMEFVLMALAAPIGDGVEQLPIIVVKVVTMSRAIGGVTN
jgi:hypothetical protein